MGIFREGIHVSVGEAVHCCCARRDRWLLLGDDHKSLLTDTPEPHRCRPHQLTPRKIMSTKKPIDPKVLQSLLELQAEMTTGLAGLKEVIAQRPKTPKKSKPKPKAKKSYVPKDKSSADPPAQASSGHPGFAVRTGGHLSNITPNTPMSPTSPMSRPGTAFIVENEGLQDLLDLDDDDDALIVDSEEDGE